MMQGKIREAHSQKPKTGPIPAGSLFSSAEYQKTGNGLARLFYI